MKSRADLPRGIGLLHDPALNKGTGFTEAERDALHLRGLLPPRVFTLAEQQQRILENFDRKETDLERYIFLVALQDRNETLFYRTLVDHIERMLPIVYTPTVGEACRQFGHIFRRPRGLYVSARDRGRVVELLRNWPVSDVRVIVITDGERILGLGDLGAHGMGIPIGKLALYTACAGIHPQQCLPVMLDVGTDNPLLLEDPLYIGLQQPRVRGAGYDALVEEFVMGVQEVFPGALIQFEDFATANAFALLERYRHRVPAFNDDIQGTAAVVGAALLAASRISRVPLGEQRLVFLGAGAAATGIADLVVALMVDQGLREDAARERCWLVDRKGLVVADDPGLAPNKRAYARKGPRHPDLLRTVEAVQATGIIGVSGQAGGFGTEVLTAMGRMNERPVVFALSNPTSHSECSAEEAYRVTGGRAIFASGSPFAPVRMGDRLLRPSQANNAYIFPGLGLAATLAGAARITDRMFRAAAKRLAEMVDDAALAEGRILPPLSGIRQTSLAIAEAVMRAGDLEGVTRQPLPPDLQSYVRDRMYQPEYQAYA